MTGDARVRGRRLIVGACAAAAVIVIAALIVALAPWNAVAAKPDVPPKGGLSEYSIAELSQISGYIAAQADDEAALAAASEYGLVDGEGRIVDEAGSVMLTDGRTLRLRLLDVRHDLRADGGGYAGLSFALVPEPGDPVEHAMNLSFEDEDGTYASSTGGWEASEMRAWLAGDLWHLLPADLRSAILPAAKTSTNVTSIEDETFEAGSLVGTSRQWVSETQDALWLLSASEVRGEIEPNDALGIDESMCSVYALEGAQYRCFVDADSTRLLGGDTWWLRTRTLEFSEGFWLVGTDGAVLPGFGEDARAATDPEFVPDHAWGPDHARSIVVGFCL